MRLVFVHGWGFDPAVWDGLAATLPDFAQTRVDLGFLGGAPTAAPFQSDDILIGHSLGFLWGLTRFQGWGAAIAINGFARFAGAVEEGACVRPAALRALRLALARDAEKTLANFYRSLNHTAVVEHFDAPQLAEGLALLETQQITKPLAMPGLVLAARNDPLVPVTASEYLAAVANTTVTWSEDGGHLLPLTRAPWCADAIRAFLA